MNQPTNNRPTGRAAFGAPARDARSAPVRASGEFAKAPPYGLPPRGGTASAALEARWNFQPNPAGDWPQVHPTAYVHPSAQLIGNVHVGKHVFVGPGAILRADETGPDGRTAPVVIAPGCNVQDGVVVHALGGTSVRIGPKTSLSHGCIVHGPCEIGRGSFIGFRSVVFDAHVGRGVYVGAGSIIQGVDIDDHAFVQPGTCLTAPPAGEPAADFPARTSSKERAFMRRVIRANLRLTRDYHRQK